LLFEALFPQLAESANLSFHVIEFVLSFYDRAGRNLVGPRPARYAALLELVAIPEEMELAGAKVLGNANDMKDRPLHFTLPLGQDPPIAIARPPQLQSTGRTGQPM